jgi:hypothetical protein
MLRLCRALFQQGNLPVMARAMGGAAAPQAVWSLGKLNHVAIAVGLLLSYHSKKPVLRIWIYRIHMFLGLPDPQPDPLVRGKDPDPSIIKQT